MRLANRSTAARNIPTTLMKVTVRPSQTGACGSVRRRPGSGARSCLTSHRFGCVDPPRHLGPCRPSWLHVFNRDRHSEALSAAAGGLVTSRNTPTASPSTLPPLRHPRPKQRHQVRRPRQDRQGRDYRLPRHHLLRPGEGAARPGSRSGEAHIYKLSAVRLPSPSLALQTNRPEQLEQPKHRLDRALQPTMPQRHPANPARPLPKTHNSGHLPPAPPRPGHRQRRQVCQVHQVPLAHDL
jgi:hypothetical protein